MKRRRVMTLGVMALVGVIAACGRKGDLELPPPAAEAETPDNEAPAAAEQVD